MNVLLSESALLEDEMKRLKYFVVCHNNKDDTVIVYDPESITTYQARYAACVLRGGWDFLFIADELFTDCVQVDWGSFAYKCTKEQLIELTRKTKCAISGIELLKPEKIYGIVFIEEC